MLINAEKLEQEIYIDILIYFDLVQKKRLALLDLLIAASREGLLSDSDVRQEVDTFILAVRISKLSLFSLDKLFGCISIVWLQGHVTTAKTLSFLLALLAEHKDIQVFIIK